MTAYMTVVSEQWHVITRPGDDLHGEREKTGGHQGPKEVFRLWGKGLEGRSEWTRAELAGLAEIIALMLHTPEADTPPTNLVTHKDAAR